MNESRPRTEQYIAPRIENAPDALQISKLDDLTGMGKQIDEAYRVHHPDARRKELDIERRTVVIQMLEAEGVNPGETRQEKQDFDFAITTYMIALGHDEESWTALNEETGTRPRNVAYQGIADWYKDRESVATEAHVSEPSVQPEQESNTTNEDRLHERLGSQPEMSKELVVIRPTETAVAKYGEETQTLLASTAEIHEAESAMAYIQNEYAGMVAKRTKSLFEGKNTAESIKRKGEDLSDIMAGLASDMYFKLEQKGMDHEAIVRQIDTFIAEQTEFVLSELEARRMQEYNDAKPWKKKLFDTWASWKEDNRWISKDKLKSNMTLAVPAAAVGVGAAALTTPLVGAVGAGVAIAAGARSLTRHLAGAKLDKHNTRVVNKQTEEMRNELAKKYSDNDDTDSREAETTTSKERTIDLVEYVNERTDAMRKRSRNRMLAGTAIAVTVGLVSSKAADVLQDVEWGKAAGWVGDKVQKINLPSFNNSDTPDANVKTYGPEVHDLDNPSIETPETGIPDTSNTGHDFDRDNDGTWNRFDTSPDGVEDPSLDHDGDGVRNWVDLALNDSLIDLAVPDISESARKIVPSEGGWQTLKELGVPAYKRDEIWADAGAILQNRDLTYLMEDGNFGWSHEGRLSNADLRVLVEAAGRHGVNL